MATLKISEEQFKSVNALANKVGDGVSVADVWGVLASFGDSYAKGAEQVLGKPGSLPWTIVRSVWNVNSADFSQFQSVAKIHLNNYIAEISRLLESGENNLPASDFIEKSYIAALEAVDLPPYIAIDVVLQKVKSAYHISPPHWYNTKGIIELEPERIRPSDPGLYEHLDAEKAREIWLQTGLHGIQNYLHTAPASMQATLAMQLNGWMAGGKSFSISNEGGVSYYFNAETGNWAFFDQNHHGRAYVDGKLRDINQDTWRPAPDSGQYQLRVDDARWQTVQRGDDGVRLARHEDRLYMWSPGGFAPAYRLAALDQANALSAAPAGQAPGVSEDVMRHAGQRVDTWSAVLERFPGSHLATDAEGHHVLLDGAGGVLGEVRMQGTMGVALHLRDGRRAVVFGDGRYMMTERNTLTGMHETTLYGADGGRIGLAPESVAQNLAYAVGATVSFLNLVQAIRSGKPLPIMGAGINTLAAINPSNTVLSAGSAGVGAVASLLSLQRNLQRNDLGGSLVAGANLVAQGATAYANALGYSATQSASAVSHAAAAGQYGAASGAVGATATALPYINLVYNLSQQNYTGAALAALSIAFPPAAPFLMVAGMIMGGVGEGDLPSAIGGYKWTADGGVAVDIRWTRGGGDNILASYLGNYRDALSAMLAQQAQQVGAQLGLVVNRLPSMHYGVHGSILTYRDPDSGTERRLVYDRDGQRPRNADAGSPESFRSLNEQFIYAALGNEAIAAQWEARTAWLQSLAHDPQAGLTEYQRAQRNGQLAATLPSGSEEQGWRPVVLDLEGEGIERIAKNTSSIYFDVDDSGFLKQTEWIGRTDGLLVLDRNHNGTIDHGTELFSNARVADAARGLASLRWIDANVDGVLTAADPVFDHLRVWQDLNGSGTVERDEYQSLAQMGISALHYVQGRYVRHGQARRLASPLLLADAVGVRTHVVEGGIMVHSSDGEVSMIVTQTEDLSHIKPGKDHIAHGVEDVALDILAGDLLRNDRVGGSDDAVLRASLRIAAVSHARHGTVELRGDSVRFTPTLDYHGSDAGFSYTVVDVQGGSASAEVVISVASVNDAPVIHAVRYPQQHAYGFEAAFPHMPFFSPRPGHTRPMIVVPNLGTPTVTDADGDQLTYSIQVPGMDMVSEPWPRSEVRRFWALDHPDLRHYVHSKQPMDYRTRHGWVRLDNDGTWFHEPYGAVYGPFRDAFLLTATDSHGASTSRMIIVDVQREIPPKPFEHPIVLDMDRNGIVLQPVQDSQAFYDILDDGWRYQMGWTTGADALLTVDLNGDGRISGRGELSFKDYLPGAQTDLEGLAAFDGNHDGKIDSDDAIWGRLRIWHDADGDGQSVDDELSSCVQAGMVSIALAGDQRFSISNGNLIHGMTQVTMVDGSTLDAADVAFERVDRVLLVAPDGTRTVHSRAAQAEPSQISGSEADDVLLGTVGSNRIDGGAGQDFIFDDQGNDVIDAGSGDDVVYAGANDDVVVGGQGGDTLFGGLGHDLLWGGQEHDMLLGEAGNDVLFGGAGDDLADGGEGDDVVAGEAGDDLLFGNGGSDALFGGAGADHLAGGDGQDRLQGDDGDDWLDGGQGNDVMLGGDGNDAYLVDDPADVVTEQADHGIDTVRTWLDGYVLPEHVENLELLVQAQFADQAVGIERISAHGNLLDNHLQGAAELSNLLHGQAGDDLLRGGALFDQLHGGPGNDRLEGGGGDDRLMGGTGNDLLYGGDGDDQLRHGTGDNLLIGGRGNDVVTAFTGRDVIAFNRGDGQDAVRLITGQDKTLSLGGGIGRGDLSLERNGMDLLLHTGQDDSIRFSNWYDAWYGDVASHSLPLLQIILPAGHRREMSEQDDIRGHKVQHFDFNQLVRHFDATDVAADLRGCWYLSHAMAGAYLGDNGHVAIGGSAARDYAVSGNLPSPLGVGGSMWMN